MPGPHTANATPPVALSFAASDPSGGTGIQSDAMTFAALGCHPLSVLTAITIQDSTGVEDVLPVDPDCVEDQARLLLEDIPVKALKIGQLGNADTIVTVAEIAFDYSSVPLVVDPMLSSSRGDELASEEMIDAMREVLLRQATVLVVNSSEARRLAVEDEDERMGADLGRCARRLIALGAEHVLITGVRERTTQVINVLYRRDGPVQTDTWQRLPGRFHGPGCILSAAIAAFLAHGADVNAAVRAGQSFTYQTLTRAFRPGMGQLLPSRVARPPKL